MDSTCNMDTNNAVKRFFQQTNLATRKTDAKQVLFNHTQSYDHCVSYGHTDGQTGMVRSTSYTSFRRIKITLLLYE
uniref:HDC16753 n=1 Tax=Drosophila melanogaster TaxID=7227 RepID=Q6IIW6_DROME|nr:TPA_inf: HDC16753 [Drosophila melanogaster]